MAGIKCTCGEIIKFNEIPNPNEWRLISDVKYDEYTGMIDAEDLDAAMKSMIICNRCNRLWIYWNGFENDPTPYKPEEI